VRRESPPARLSAALGAVLIAVTGCNFAPRYEPPKSTATAEYKEAVPGTDPASAGWKRAEPNDATLRARWWEMYEDPDLNELESRVVISNQTIIAAEANYRAAHALVLEAQAQLFPTFTLAPSATREKSSGALAKLGGGVGIGTTAGGTAAGGTVAGGGTTPGGGATTITTSSSAYTAPRNIFSVPLEASYQLDLWGNIRNQIAANRYSAEASASTLANTLLSTQSTLAQDYFQLRVADEQRRILEATAADDRESLRLVRSLVSSGVDSEADVATAESTLESAQAAATDAGVARAQYEHAIAVLIGLPPGQLSIPYRHLQQRLPVIPVGVPSDLLERRPDIAAAERQVAQSNAQIGVARAAFFPTLTLGATGGYESTRVSNLFDAPNTFWSVGPMLSQILFDGGERRAAVLQARAQNESQVASYRQTVLSAFQSVEDNLAALRIYGTELEQAHRATVAAQRAVELTVVLFKQGIDSYVQLLTVQNAFLSARETELQVRLKQLVASVTLINDLGGGWDSRRRPDTERTAMHPPGDAARVPLPGQDQGTVPNPPQIPAREIEPDEILRQNRDAVEPLAPSPSPSAP
jgi:NodT family efflux transporter outer membrane factor (OMF) lipoprotein